MLDLQTPSPSEINMYYNMGLAFKLIKIDGVPTQMQPNYRRDLGFNMHNVIKHYYQQIHEKPTPEYIERTAKSCFVNHFDQALSEHKTEAEATLRNFILFEKRRLPNYRKPILIEKYMKSRKYRGVPDMFDGVTVYDWKFGSLLKLYDDQRIQGGAYKDLLYDNGFKPIEGYNDFKVKFVTLQSTAELEMPFTTTAWLDEKREIMINGVKAGKFPPCNKYLCPYCDCAKPCAFKDNTLWEAVDALWNQ